MEEAVEDEKEGRSCTKSGSRRWRRSRTASLKRGLNRGSGAHNEGEESARRGRSPRLNGDAHDVTTPSKRPHGRIVNSVRWAAREQAEGREMGSCHWSPLPCLHTVMHRAGKKGPVLVLSGLGRHKLRSEKGPGIGLITSGSANLPPDLGQDIG